jgi:hypothetical protein
LIQLDDEVCMSAQFLRDTGQQTGRAAERRGKVIGFCDGMPELAQVRWHDMQTSYVNVANLIQTKHIGADAAKAKPGFQKTHKGL